MKTLNYKNEQTPFQPSYPVCPVCKKRLLDYQDQVRTTIGWDSKINMPTWVMEHRECADES